MLVYLTYIVVAVGTAATLMMAFGSPAASSMVVVPIASLVYLTLKAEMFRRQLGDLQRLQTAYAQLDQQAKLIIRTDLELHRAQEELDRRLASLMSLHQLGRQLQVSLHPDEIFQKMDAAVVTNFGFSKGLLGLSQSLTTLEWSSLVGIPQTSAEEIQRYLLGSGLLKQTLTNPVPLILQRTTTTDPTQQKLFELLDLPVVVIAGILPHTGPAGVLLLGRTSGVTNAKAEEELVAILTNQLAIAVENSSLYEETWTAQHELEQKVQERTRELAEANAGLVRLNRAKSDFVSAVSHELRTPLAAIKGYAALLGSGQFGPLASTQAERIAKIEKHSDLLAQFINNLLDIARIESGRITMEHQAISIDEFFSAIYDVINPQLQAKHLQYSVEHDGVQELLGDSQHLQRVFINLLSNAIKYTPEHGNIRIELKRDGTNIVAMVSDTGHGIGPDDLQKLFQEFYRANDPINQQVRGTGLGLALVKRIVEAHHGRIWVTSERGKGSTFFVSLPTT